MELLTRTWRDLWRRIKPDVWFSIGILAALLTVELVGRRQATTDVHDLFALLLLAGIGYLVAQRHLMIPLGWVRGLGQLAQRAADWLQQRYAMEVGFDLRGRPRLLRGLPRPLMIALGLIVFGALLAVPLAEHLPLGLRGVLVHVWYLGYLVFLALLWAGLLGGTFLAIGFPFALIHDAFVSRSAARTQRSARAEGVALVGYFAFFMMAAFHLPAWVPLAVCLLALAINIGTTVIPANPDVQILWRYRRPGAVLHAIPWGWWVTWEFTFLTMAAVNLGLWSAGSSILGHTPTAAQVASAAPPGTEVPAIVRPPLPHEAMPITTSLGLMLAWLASGALGLRVGQSVLVRLRDPARPCPPMLHVRGDCSSEQRRTITRHFRAQGWAVRWAPQPSQPTDVCVMLVADPAPADPDRVSWPLRVTVAELLAETVRKRLARRAEIQLRRQLVAGLKRLFKQAASRKYQRGTGLWIAPHLWFIPGISRDSREDELDLEQGTILSGMVGMPYHRVFPRSVRNHVYLILRALHIDLIFVEDGVGFRRFCRVLRMMFELYDVYGGRRRADEVHFQGLPGVRVLIHDYVLDEPFKSETYPEPEFESLGRARILHVFKDRGEQEEPLETPLDWTNMPAPSAAL
jgi:hypothetical protein